MFGLVIEIMGPKIRFLKIADILCKYLASSQIPIPFQEQKLTGNLVRLGAAICGIIVACDNFSNVNVIIAEIILSQIGSFVLYYALVGFYHSSAKYYGFWQTNLGRLIQTLQHLTLYVLVALAIASGVEGSDYTNASDVTLAQNLSKAYSIICLFPV